MQYLGVNFDLKHIPQLDAGFIPFGVWAEAYSKNATTPIAIAIAESHGGVAAIAATCVAVAGVTGVVCAPLFAKWFFITCSMFRNTISTSPSEAVHVAATSSAKMSVSITLPRATLAT